MQQQWLPLISAKNFRFNYYLQLAGLPGRLQEASKGLGAGQLRKQWAGDRLAGAQGKGGGALLHAAQREVVGVIAA